MGVSAALVGFARLLRQRGLSASPAQVATYQAAVARLGGGGIDDLYWAGRICLSIPGPSRVLYDNTFAEYFLGRTTMPGADAPPQPPDPSSETPEPDSGPKERQAPLDVARESSDDEDGEESPADPTGDSASVLEVLRITPFQECTPEELDVVIALVRRLRGQPPTMLSRRTRPGRHGRRLDVRATTRLAMRTQAELILPRWRRPRRRWRPVVVLLDVSRSMAPYSRLLLHFAHALATSGRTVEVVCFGTRITRVTHLLRSRRSPRALEDAAMAVLDWNGGTRIADAVSGLRTLKGVRTMLRGAVVVICSDGLEQGEASDLGRQMSALRRSCHRVLWVNPLAGDARYEPTAQGMRAALPYVDRLIAGDTLAALEEVADALGASASPPPGALTPFAHHEAALAARTRPAHL